MNDFKQFQTERTFLRLETIITKMSSDFKRVPSRAEDRVKLSSRSSVFSTASLPLPLTTRPKKNPSKLSKLPIDLSGSNRSLDAIPDANGAPTGRFQPSRSSHRTQRSSKDIFNSSLQSNRSKKSSVKFNRIDYDIYSKEHRQTPLDTERRVPVVEWKKIRSVPETERADESVDTTDSINLNKCLSCSSEGVILKLLPCLHSFCQRCLEHKIDEHPR